MVTLLLRQQIIVLALPGVLITAGNANNPSSYEAKCLAGSWRQCS
jgi:hypothetical protein